MPPSWNFIKRNISSRSGVFAQLRQKSTEEQTRLIESSEVICAALLDEVHRDVLAVNEEEYLQRVASVDRILGAHGGGHNATVGIMLTGVMVDNLLIGGPAMGSGKIQKGDKIIKVDGEPVSAAGVDHALIGNDVPGSLIRLTVIKEGSGAEEEVAITRMATSKIADKRRMFELFSEIKDAYLKSKGGDSGLFGVKIPGVDLGGGIDISERVDEALKLWTKMQMRETAHTNEQTNHVLQLQKSSHEHLELIRVNLGKLHAWHDRDLAFYAEQDKKHEDERRLAAENQREWESRVAELERLLVESRTKCDEQVHLLAAACEERDTNAADSKAARADAAREHDARALAEHERDELAALLAKMREQLKTLQDQLHDVEAERDALRRECAGLKEEVAKLHDQVESMEKQRDSLQKQIKEASASASKETEEALAALRLKIKALQDQLHAAEEARDVNAREAAAAGKRCSQAEQALAKSSAECEDLRALVAKLRTQLAEKTAAAEAAVSERDRVKAELSVTQGRLKAEIDEKTRAVHERDAAVREHKPCAGLIADLRRQLADLSAQRALPPTPPAGPPRRAGVGLLLHQDEVDKLIVVEKLTTGGAAEDDGRIRPGDILHSVDGKPVTDMDMAPKLIAGDEGTEIILEMERPETGVVSYYTMKRKVVNNLGATVAVHDVHHEHRTGITPRGAW